MSYFDRKRFLSTLKDHQRSGRCGKADKHDAKALGKCCVVGY